MSSIYPIFKEDSIKERFENDINKFKNNLYNNSDNNSDLDVEYYLTEIKYFSIDIKSFDKNYFKIEIIDKINKISSNSKKSVQNFGVFNYSHDITNFEITDQANLWCVRTVFFCKLLIIATKMMEYSDFFLKIYEDTNYKRTFKQDIISELEKYKMGIFGSLTPTSDIDVGIQYSGNNSESIGLSYIVSIIEDLFIILTGKNSLEFDIELYADMMTLPNLNKDTSKKFEDVFYLDTSNFEKKHFYELLPYIEASILRNYVTVKTDNNSNNNIKEIVNSFNYTDFFEKSIKTEELKNKYNSIVEKLLESDNESFVKPSDASKEMIINYMSSEYDTARTEYYKYVDTAENSLKEVRESYYKNNSIDLKPEKIVEIMKNIAHALVYRAESYTCAPTVMHVVRVLQANKDNPNKYVNLQPGYCLTNKFTDAYCNIGIFGYLMSMYEQLGYIYRFHLNYCETNDYNEIKCDKKYEKYNYRFKHAIDSIEKKNCGKKSTTKKRTKKQNKTKRKQNKTKTKRKFRLFKKNNKIFSKNKK